MHASNAMDARIAGRVADGATASREASREASLRANADRTNAVRAVALAAAVACIPALAAAAAAVPGGRLGVSLLEEGDVVRLQVRTPPGLEPEFGTSANAGGRGHRVVLTWRDVALATDGELPAARGLLRTLGVRNDNGATRLELQSDVAVSPQLRRAADGWIVTLAPHRDASVTAKPAPRAAAEAVRPRAVAEALLLDMRINGQSLPAVVRAEQTPSGALLLAANDWTEARLNPGEATTLSDGTPAYRLDQIAGLTYRIDRGTLQLEVNAPATAFIGSSLGPRGAAAPVITPSEPGVLVNYDVSATRPGDGRGASAGAAVELVAFGPYGSFVTSALVTHDGDRTRAQRLDSYWRYDMPERMESIVVGDTVGSGGGWSRPARFTGVRWGRDFGMRPGFVTMPVPALAGEAALPSTVEVLVNNARRLSTPVQPGPFDLSNVPFTTGAGEVNLVVRDLLGRETLIRQSYYASPRLLAPGLSDFSFEVGKLRTGYGADASYGDAFATATVRQGITPALTAEGRVELQPDRRAAGVEVAGTLGDLAVARAAVAVATGDRQGAQETGTMVQVGVERQWPTGGATLQYEYATRGFAPFAEPLGEVAVAQRARSRLLASAGGSLGAGFSAGITFARQARWDGDKVTTVGLSFGVPVIRGASLGFHATKRLDGERDWTAGVNLTIPLEEGIHAGARVDRNADGRTVANASAVKSPPVGPGLGWRVEASTEQSQRARAGVQYNAEHAELAADGVADAQGRVSVRAGARGSVGWLAGTTFASRPVGQNGFAIVEVEGTPDVPVRRANQVVATTDANGRALVTGLLPWQRNRLELDPVDLPMDVEMRDFTQEVTPAARSGTVVRFAMNRSRQALVVLHGEDGEPLPVGARVRLGASGPEFLTGRRGEVWLTELAEGRQVLEVHAPKLACRAVLDVPGAQDGMPERIGPLACRKDAP